ncbi:MAG: hypothetical protein CVU64_09115 [Deltaproteobacteria bacterium HGW-Deltaproteobacteria-21]|nr:MAG: hypothetical protein CVU64_09115 [Deltaproteobacteria bacterium HGW-Deltaproteobacteria-21]
MTTEGYQEIERFLSETTGLDPESLGRKSIANAVDAAMKALGIRRVVDYLGALRSGVETLEDLLERVVVPETWFFRDGETFNYLSIYLEERGFPGSEKKPLRILSAPCSTGQEPYSIAMTLLEMGYSPERFRIDAVDISAKSIHIARKGLYGRGSFRQKGKDRHQHFFSKGEDGLRIDPKVSGLVHFYRDNLAVPFALRKHERYDIVFCRNLLIYLTENGRRAVLANIDRLLVADGLLFAGNSEVVFFFQNGYLPVKHARSFACRKTGTCSLQAVVAPRPRPAPLKKEPRVRVNMKTVSAPGRREKVPETVQRVHAATSLQEVRDLADRGELHEALRLCEQFLRANRCHIEGYYIMGLINFALDSFTAAEEFFQKALYLDPHHYETLIHMGLLYEKKGDHSKASIIKDRIERFRLNQADPQETL